MATGLDALMYEFTLQDDDYYTAVGIHFAVCDVLMVTDPELIPARWEFRPSPLWNGAIEEDSYDSMVMLDLVESGTVTTADLVAYGDFLAAHAAKVGE